jgi:hypothetical protein
MAAESLVIGILRTDGEAVYVEGDVRDYCKEQGIKREITPRYTPERNGVAETCISFIWHFLLVPNWIIVSERFFVIFSKVAPLKALFLVFFDFFDKAPLKKVCFIDVFKSF